MSLRHFRKVCGGPQLPPPDDGPDEYEPPCARNANRSAYAGLVISDQSESDHGPPSEEEEPLAGASGSNPTRSPTDAKKKTKKQKKRKSRKAKDKVIIDPEVYEELDEIDRSLLEVNAELGEPEVPPVQEPKVDELHEMRKIFTVRQQFMHAGDEMDRIFGPDETKEPKKRVRMPNLRFISQKGYIINTEKIFKKQGLSMTLIRCDKDVRYFAFCHSKDYQDTHRRFLFAQHNQLNVIRVPSDDPSSDMHVEGLLDTVDRLYEMEEYKVGNRVIEDIITFMQQSSHPFFSVTDVRTRLEYNYVENRAFHIAMLKHMHMLTNKACHRTALEMAKILLNLDPSDPLAVLFVIDTIALRAREHKWLIQAIDYWKKKRNAEYLFTMQYSYALSHFHVARKEKALEDAKMGRHRLQVIKDKNERTMAALCNWKITLQRLDREREERKAIRRNTEGALFDKSNELIKNAMLRYPTVVTRIFENAGIRSARVQASPLFNAEADKLMSKNLKDLIRFYGCFVWNKFSEDIVSQWLVRNAEQLAEEYDNDPAVRAQAKIYANIRMNLFQCLPIEIIRHLSLISSLNSLMFDGAAPDVGSHSSFDPEPPLDSINRYRYNEDPLPGDESTRTVFELFNSLLPTHENNDVPTRQFMDLPVHQARRGLNDLDSDTESDFSDHGYHVPGMLADPAMFDWPLDDDNPIGTSGMPLSAAVRRLFMHMMNDAYGGDDAEDDETSERVPEDERVNIQIMLNTIRQHEEEGQSVETPMPDQNVGALFREFYPTTTEEDASLPFETQIVGSHYTAIDYYEEPTTEQSLNSRYRDILQAAMEGDTSSSLQTQVVDNHYRTFDCYLSLCNVNASFELNDYRDPGHGDRIENPPQNDLQEVIVDLLHSEDEESDEEEMDFRGLHDHIDYDVQDYPDGSDYEMSASDPDDRDMNEERAVYAGQDDDDDDSEGENQQSPEDNEDPQNIEEEQANEVAGAAAGMMEDRNAAENLQAHPADEPQPFDFIRSLQNAVGVVYELSGVDTQYEAINPTPDVRMFLYQVIGENQNEQRIQNPLMCWPQRPTYSAVLQRRVSAPLQQGEPQGEGRQADEKNE